MSILYYIIALAINLTSGYSKEFILTIDNGDIKKNVKCRISYINNDIWKTEIKESGSDTINRPTINFKVKKQPNNTIQTFVLGEPFKSINLNRFFEFGKTDWKNATEIKTKFKNKLMPEKEVIALIKREKDKIYINKSSEESLGGYCKRVIIEW